MSEFLETVMTEFDRMRARAEGYAGVTHAGIALIGGGSGRVLLAQRAFDETDDEDVRETYEFPGGGLKSGEDPFTAASREFEEEIGAPLPPGEVVNGWRSADGVYQGFVYAATDTSSLDLFTPTDEVQAVGWYSPEEATSLRLRPEMRDFDWALLDVKESEMDETTETEPDLSILDLAMGPVPVHGILAPEGLESGDGRGFSEGAMTQRPYRLPFMWQKVQTSGHDGAVVIGSVDRLMRKDGMIHWEGSLLQTPEANEFAEILSFFGRFGVSVDGDAASIDRAKSGGGVMWFEAVRAAGLTAVSIPAFAEAYVAFGQHPEMPEADSEEFAILTAAGTAVQFDRGPGWVTNPKETKRIHDYWMPGHPGGDKIAWGTPGDFTRAKKLIGEKIGANSPEDLRFLNQIIAQWHHDALGYWPGELGKPGNKPKASLSIERDSIEVTDDGWEAVLTASVSGNRPPLDYFHRHESTEAIVVEDPDADGFRRTYGYAAKWGVCHIGMNGRCTEPPRTYSDDYPSFHLGVTKVDGGGFIPTGVLTYGIGHRDAETMLSESADQAYFDNINNAWAAVRIGEDDEGIWFSGVVLPDVPDDHIVKIEASGQVSGEWLRGELRACLTVNVPGFPVERASAEYDDEGNVIALAASAFGGVENPCDPTPADRMQALRAIDAEVRMSALRAKFNWVDTADTLMAEAEEEGRVVPVGLREDGAIVYEIDGERLGGEAIVAPMPEEA